MPGTGRGRDVMIELSFGAFSPRHLSCTWAAVVAAFGRGRRGRRGRWRIAREKCKSLCSAERRLCSLLRRRNRFLLNLMPPSLMALPSLSFISQANGPSSVQPSSEVRFPYLLSRSPHTRSTSASLAPVNRVNACSAQLHPHFDQI